MPFARVAVLSLAAAACASAAREELRSPADEHVLAVRVAVDPAGGPTARSACTAHALDGATGFWRVAADSVASFDQRVVRGVDSLFARLRSSPRFDHLGSAADYHRQYLGIWFDGQPFVYVHGVNLKPLRRMRIPMSDLALDQHLISLCDGGTSVFGLLLDPASGTLGRLEFGQGFGGAHPYDDIVPPDGSQDGRLIPTVGPEESIAHARVSPRTIGARRPSA